MDDPLMNTYEAHLLGKAEEYILELREALEEITRPFPSMLTMDDLADHNKMIREKFELKFK